MPRAPAQHKSHRSSPRNRHPEALDRIGEREQLRARRGRPAAAPRRGRRRSRAGRAPRGCGGRDRAPRSGYQPSCPARWPRCRGRGAHRAPHGPVCHRGASASKAWERTKPSAERQRIPGGKSCRSHVDGAGARQPRHGASRSGGRDDAASRQGVPSAAPGARVWTRCLGRSLTGRSRTSPGPAGWVAGLAVVKRSVCVAAASTRHDRRPNPGCAGTPTRGSSLAVCTRAGGGTDRPGGPVARLHCAPRCPRRCSCSALAPSRAVRSGGGYGVG